MKELANKHKGQLEHLELKLGYKFKNVELLIQALTHKSYSATNYERLEFVGDGVLDYVIALNLFLRYPSLAEGELSNMRSSLVNQDGLVIIANNLNLGEYLLLGDGELKSGGRSRPSILADSIEAIFAAISLDGSFEDAKRVITHLFADLLENYQLSHTKDAKSKLQEYAQAKKVGVPIYTVIKLSGPDHNSVFSVECSIPLLGVKEQGSGKSKKEASQLAATKVLKILLKKD